MSPRKPKTLKIDEVAAHISPVFTGDVASRFATWRMLMNYDLGKVSDLLKVSTSTVMNMERGHAGPVRFTFKEFMEAIGDGPAVWILTGSGKPPRSHADAELERKERQRRARAKQWDQRIEAMLERGLKEEQIRFIYPTAYAGFLERKKLSEKVKTKGVEADNCDS
jgi:transcriptional regulator with XRE-family HTH domain